MKILTPFIIILIFASCNKTDNTIGKQPKEEKILTSKITLQEDRYEIPPRPKYITGDFDGDSKLDTVHFTKHPENGKYGLKLVFANHKIDTIGMGKDVIGQGFDDIERVGIFERAPKGESYAENVSEEGDILSEEEIPAEAWIKLPNDGIFIHAAESCGGGVIYLDKGTYKWIQQE